MRQLCRRRAPLELAPDLVHLLLQVAEVAGVVDHPGRHLAAVFVARLQPDAPAGVVATHTARLESVEAGLERRLDDDHGPVLESPLRLHEERHVVHDHRIRGRLKDLVVSGGENVYPAEIEAVLHEHPAVADAAVLGAPDDRWGEICIAFVVLESPVSEEELRQHCYDRLARFKVPKAFHVVGELPRNSMGKIQKSELKVTA